MFVFVVQNEAVIYHEPEGKIVSRSGDDCIVALCDQWFAYTLFVHVHCREHWLYFLLSRYLDYGNFEWKDQARKHLESVNT